MFFNLLTNFKQNLAEGKDHLNFQEIRQQREEKVKQVSEPREELERECSLRQPSVHMGKSYNKHLNQGKAFIQWATASHENIRKQVTFNLTVTELCVLCLQSTFYFHGIGGEGIIQLWTEFYYFQLQFPSSWVFHTLFPDTLRPEASRRHQCPGIKWEQRCDAHKYGIFPALGIAPFLLQGRIFFPWTLAPFSQPDD